MRYVIEHRKGKIVELVFLCIFYITLVLCNGSYSYKICCKNYSGEEAILDI